ncbi:Receptor-type tyrosine-protein phosphatase H [Larimichthys crocea]|uniref:Uncharacterized protein n=1 Tax=Larimichthys crocea TaxID=215358 RepID=A0ACD3Q590_LARCR|nr:Receptor-type tyrosine-protein phosphatase H [Larimichthys crocea]
MLSFGPWVEKNCFELLPFICYDDDIVYETSVSNVTNLTSVSATLTWQPVPDVINYRLEVKGVKEMTRNLTNVTDGLFNLTPGTQYTVQVFPIKCGRDLNAQEFFFTTIPNKVENFTVLSQNETRTLYLSWDKPFGNIDLFEIHYSGKEIKTKKTHAKVVNLTPGVLYTFNITSVAAGPDSTRSEKSTITVYTKPGKVSNLKASDNSQEWLLLSWDSPEGDATHYWVKALDENNILRFNQTVTGRQVNVTNLPISQNITLSVIALANGTLKGDNVTIYTYTAPGQISDLVLKSTHDTVTADWNAPHLGKSSSFNIELKVGSETKKYNVHERTKTFHNLNTAANYTVIVSISNGHVDGLPVQDSIFTLPLPPTHPKIPFADKEHITFSWTAPANSLNVTYVVEIKSDFYHYNTSAVVHHHTQYNFTGLKSGTKYDLTVKTKAGGNYSVTADISHCTDAKCCQTCQLTACVAVATTAAALTMAVLLCLALCASYSFVIMNLSSVMWTSAPQAEQTSKTSGQELQQCQKEHHEVKLMLHAVTQGDRCQTDISNISVCTLTFYTQCSSHAVCRLQVQGVSGRLALVEESLLLLFGGTAGQLSVE